MAKFTGRFGKLSIGDVAGTVFTEVAQVSSIGSVAITADETEVTTLDNTSGYREYLQTFKDAGELPVTLVWDPALPTHGTASGGLWALFISGETRKMKIEFPTKPTAYEASFDGWVKTFPTPAMTPDDALTAEVTIRVTGTVTLAAKAAAFGLGAGEEMTPEERAWRDRYPDVPLPPRRSATPVPGTLEAPPPPTSPQQYPVSPARGD